MENYAAKLQSGGHFFLNWEELKIGCFPHTINISTQKVVTAVVDVQDDDLAAQVSARNPQALLRMGIRSIRASGKRREEFRSIVDQGNKQNWWLVNNQPVQLKNRELILDVPTRWDSSYQMDNRALELQPALDYFFQLPQNTALAPYRLTPDEWKGIQDITVMLSVPSRIQQALCSERTPSLSFALPNFEWLVTSWERLAAAHPHLEPFLRPGLDSAYQYYRKMNDNPAYVIAMCKYSIFCMT
ncbi:hypothetical protein BDN72DRAFT_780245 [Pluteus cervinus]|uniref:Uncharacterized protein n=1 Tax=Pluteus cervinus TaxID=181527 RepID=A0ACD3A296_9AGAR|nr:hypothetical protein BDN72DRAFT_780245 [Pluteus cervinus]